jgi:ferric-dicitrate binding protein FerR (iron transport regulator)
MDELEKKINERLQAYQPPFDRCGVSDAKARIFARTVNLEESKEIQSNAIPLWKNYRVAATIALLIAIPFALVFLGKNEITATEDLQICQLPDGSNVEVAVGSEINFNEITWGISRKVELKGEAHFKVAKGEVFEVETERGSVEVLGTEFTVWENDDALVVHCAEGKVRINEHTTLVANEYVVLENGNLTKGEWKTEKKFIGSAIDHLSFESTPLSIVVEILEEAFDQKIILESERDLQFSGSLDPENFDQSLILLTKPFGLEVAMKRSAVVILEPK